MIVAACGIDAQVFEYRCVCLGKEGGVGLRTNHIGIVAVLLTIRDRRRGTRVGHELVHLGAECRRERSPRQAKDRSPGVGRQDIHGAGRGRGRRGCKQRRAIRARVQSDPVAVVESVLQSAEVHGGILGLQGVGVLHVGGGGHIPAGYGPGQFQCQSIGIGAKCHVTVAELMKGVVNCRRNAEWIAGIAGGDSQNVGSIDGRRGAWFQADGEFGIGIDRLCVAETLLGAAFEEGRGRGKLPSVSEPQSQTADHIQIARRCLQLRSWVDVLTMIGGLGRRAASGQVYRGRVWIIGVEE